jgi:hypothetical protein
VGCDSIEANLVKFRDVSPFKEVVVNRGDVEVVHYSVDEDELSSESCILDLFQEGIVKSGDVGTGFVLNSVLTAVSVSGLVTKHNVELDEVEVVSRGKVV